jgi:hypothetical protein
VNVQGRYEAESLLPSATLTDHVAEYDPDIDEILITGEEIQAKIASLGEEITDD